MRLLLGMVLFGCLAVVLVDQYLRYLVDNGIRKDRQFFVSLVEASTLTFPATTSQKFELLQGCIQHTAPYGYRFQTCYDDGAIQDEYGNTVWRLMYWPPRSKFSVVSESYYFSEVYGALTKFQFDKNKDIIREIVW